MAIGTASYQHGGMRRAPHQVFEQLKKKCALRAALLMITAEIDAAVAGLSQTELLELQNLMAEDVAAADVDVAALRQQVEAEASAATKGMHVQLPRRTSETIAAIIEERISRGNYPSASTIISEAVERLAQ